MNIFVLDNDVRLAAQYHIDKHCVKMVLETTQLLNNAMIIGSPAYEPVYKQTHKNHPCSIWASESLDNFEWLAELGLALCKEYTLRYSKIHKCQSIIKGFRMQAKDLVLPKIGLTPYRLCMPDQYKVESPVESYRNYYRGDKAYIAKWTKRSQPDWWNQ
jgi:hypothetical protein